MEITHDQFLRLCVLVQCAQIPQTLGMSAARTVKWMVERANKIEEEERNPQTKPIDSPGQLQFRFKRIRSRRGGNDK